MKKFYDRKSPVTGEEHRTMLEPRYGGMPTFMRTPLADTLENLDIALAGVPYDGGVTNRPGARHGPREMRSQSSFIREFHHVTRITPFE